MEKARGREGVSLGFGTVEDHSAKAERIKGAACICMNSQVLSTFFINYFTVQKAILYYIECYRP